MVFKLWRLPLRVRDAAPALCRRGSQAFPWVVVRSPTKPPRPIERGGELVLLFNSHDAAALAAGLREGHRQRPDGLGDQARPDLALAGGARTGSLLAHLRSECAGPRRG